MILPRVDNFVSLNDYEVWGDFFTGCEGKAIVDHNLVLQVRQDLCLNHFLPDLNFWTYRAEKQRESLSYVYGDSWFVRMTSFKGVCDMDA